MILKRPYAFLIKHFKLIHLIITFILGYILVENREIYIYIKSCIADSVNKYDALTYINYNIYIFIVLAIMLFFIVYWLLKYKDKPRNIYIFSIVSYVIVGIVLFVIFSYFSGLPNNVIDQKTIRLYRDILSITLVFQYYFIIIMLMRGLGFNIKKFNFSKDFQELNINEEDAEEVEVNVGLDTTNLMRNVRKQKREFGYFFREFKVYVIIIIVFLICIFGYKGYNYFQNKYKIYSENVSVGDVNSITVSNSYYTKMDDKNYIIIKFNAYRNDKQDRLSTGSMALLINNKKYYPDKNICYKFSYLGTCYKKQYITSQEKSYIFVYPIEEENIKKSYLIYTESYDILYKIKLDLENYEG